MKTATIPPIRIEESFRAEIESVLAEGETISGLAEAALRRAVEYRKVQAAFHGRGEQALEEARRTGVTYTHDEVFANLRGRVEQRRRSLATKSKQAKLR